jgi:gluconolactonase
MKVDVRGNIWMTGPGGLHVLSPQGRLLGRIQLPMRATNFTFGDDFRSLFIVASPNIYRLRTLVRGVVPPHASRKVQR